MRSDQNSNATGLVNATHQHVEFTLLDIAIFDFTKGYEVFVFDYGTFYRAGDGGYENWCTWGEFDEYDDNTEIVYYPSKANPLRTREFLLTRDSSLLKRTSEVLFLFRAMGFSQP